MTPFAGRTALAALAIAALPGAACAAEAPGGEVAAVTPQGIVLVRDADDPAPRTLLEGDYGAVQWSPDGRLLAAVDARGRAVLLEPDGGRVVRRIAGVQGLAWWGDRLVVLRRRGLEHAGPDGTTRLLVPHRRLVRGVTDGLTLAGVAGDTAWLVAPDRGASAYGGPPQAVAARLTDGAVQVRTHSRGLPDGGGNVYPGLPGLALDGRPAVDIGLRAGGCEQGEVALSEARSGRWVARFRLPRLGRPGSLTRLIDWTDTAQGAWVVLARQSPRACRAGNPEAQPGQVWHEQGGRLRPTGLRATAIAVSPAGDRLALVEGILGFGPSPGLFGVAGGDRAGVAPGALVSADAAGGARRVLLAGAYGARWRPAAPAAVPAAS